MSWISGRWALTVCFQKRPGALLKIYVYGYINQIASSRRLERETHRNVEIMWLTGRLTPDYKTIADFSKENGPAIRGACRQFIALCRQPLTASGLRPAARCSRAGCPVRLARRPTGSEGDRTPE